MEQQKPIEIVNHHLNSMGIPKCEELIGRKIKFTLLNVVTGKGQSWVKVDEIPEESELSIDYFIFDTIRGVTVKRIKMPSNKVECALLVYTDKTALLAGSDGWYIYLPNDVIYHGMVEFLGQNDVIFLG